MSIRFACDFCSRKYRVGDELAGRTVACKECGAELRIPNPETPDFPRSPQASSIMEDADEPAPTLPRRPGMIEEPSEPSRRRRSKTSAAPRNAPYLRKAGVRLLLFGVGIFVLPFLGLQWVGVGALPAEAQLGLGVLLMAAGSFCMLSARWGLIRGLLFSVLGGLAAFGALVVVVMIVGPPGGPGPNPAPQPPAFPMPQNFGPRVVIPNPPPPAPGNIGADPGEPNPPPPAAAPPVEEVDPNGPLKITLFDGKAAANEPGANGIAVQLSYRIQSREPGPLGLDLWLTSKQGRTKIEPTMQLKGQGLLTMIASGLSEADGPFEATFESEDPAAAGMTANVTPLIWSREPLSNSGRPNRAPRTGPRRKR